MQADRKADCAEHPQVIFRKTDDGISDCAENSPPEIVITAGAVDEYFFFRIKEHGVDREVAPGDVLLRRFAETQSLRAPPVLVIALLAECGDLEVHGVRDHRDDAERCAERDGAGKQLHDLRGHRIGRNVVILRELSEAEIADRAADDIRFKSGIAQFRNDSRRGGKHAAFPDIPVDFERYLHKKSLPAFEFLSFHA